MGHSLKDPAAYTLSTSNINKNTNNANHVPYNNGTGDIIARTYIKLKDPAAIDCTYTHVYTVERTA